MFIRKVKEKSKGSNSSLTYDNDFGEALERIRAHFNLASPADVIKIAIALLELERNNEIQGNQIVVVNSKGKIINKISFGEGHTRPPLAKDTDAAQAGGNQGEESSSTGEKQRQKRRDSFRL